MQGLTRDCGVLKFISSGLYFGIIGNVENDSGFASLWLLCPLCRQLGASGTVGCLQAGLS